MTETKDTPSPGSDKAVAKGCLCPVKRGGKYLRDIFNMQEGPWISADCPLHNKSDQGN